MGLLLLAIYLILDAAVKLNILTISSQLLAIIEVVAGILLLVEGGLPVYRKYRQ